MLASRNQEREFEPRITQMARIRQWPRTPFFIREICGQFLLHAFDSMSNSDTCAERQLVDNKVKQWPNQLFKACLT